MKAIMQRTMILITSMLASTANFAETLQQKHLSHSKQILLVTVNDKQKETAVLQRYQRGELHADWQKIGAPIPIVIGKQGLAREATDQSSTTLPIKKEGDLRTPIGIFPISFAFG